jgi:chorismate mutase/prephenate dehydrogenase
MDLQELRNNLSAIDRQLVELIAARQVLDSGRAHAEELGVDPDIVENLLQLLIRTSLESQERDRVVAEGKGDGRKALVIGGAGKMGRWFVDFFVSQGFATTVADVTIEDGPEQYTNWTDAGVDYDVIVVAAPLAVSGRILAQLAVLKPRGLIFDIGSLKSPLIDGLEELRSAGCRVTSLHPMYGPDTRLLSGRHLILTLRQPPMPRSCLPPPWLSNWTWGWTTTIALLRMCSGCHTR